MPQKLALITGSTSGIGLGIAEAFAKKNYNLVIHGFGEIKDINRFREDLEQKYEIRTVYSSADLSKPDQIEEMIQEIKKHFGRLDVLVNNAGIQYVAPIDQFPVDKWDSIMAVNLTSAFHTIRLVLPFMKEKKWGRIINIASAHGLVASKDKSAYVASKHGLLGLTKVVALEVADLNITCNAICPGWVDTPLMRKQVEKIAKEEDLSFDAAMERILSEKQAILKCTTPHDIGEFCAFLCREEASLMTGGAYTIDGGWTIQ